MTSTAANAALKLASEMAKSEGSVYESGLYPAIRDMVAAIAQETGIDHRQFSVELSVPSAAQTYPATFTIAVEIDDKVLELHHEHHIASIEQMQDDDPTYAPRCDGTGWVSFVYAGDNTDEFDDDTAKVVDGWVAGVQRASALSRAVALGQPAIAITDHGTLAGALAFDSASMMAGVKPIRGCEFFLALEVPAEDIGPDPVDVTTENRGVDGCDTYPGQRPEDR